jgi:hypothetical protein
LNSPSWLLRLPSSLTAAEIRSATADYLLAASKRCFAAAAFQIPEVFGTRKLVRKNLNSDDHFDRRFLFVVVTGKTKRRNAQQQLIENQNQHMKTISLLAAMFLAVLFASPATASTTQPFDATFVEIGGVTETGSCGSATISQLGHVAHQCVVFNGCGPNCELRTITFDDGTLVIQESIVGVISHGNSAGFLEITLTIDGASSTGRFAGATGDGTGVVNLNALGVVIASGTITLAD